MFRPRVVDLCSGHRCRRLRRSPWVVADDETTSQQQQQQQQQQQPEEETYCEYSQVDTGALCGKADEREAFSARSRRLSRRSPLSLSLSLSLSLFLSPSLGELRLARSLLRMIFLARGARSGGWGVDSFSCRFQKREEDMLRESARCSPVCDLSICWQALAGGRYMCVRLDKRCWLEVEDPKHRYAKNLRRYHFEWLTLGSPCGKREASRVLKATRLCPTWHSNARLSRGRAPTREERWSLFFEDEEKKTTKLGDSLSPFTYVSHAQLVRVAGRR